MTSKVLFIKDLLSQKTTNFDSLVGYSLSTDREYLKEIERFFNTLKQGNLVLGCEVLPIISEKFNELLRLYQDGLLKKRDMLLEISKLYGEAYIQIEKLDRSLQCSNSIETCDCVQKMGKKIINGKKVLIVDDDIIILSVLEKIFTNAGYDVILSSNPFSVISIVKDNKVDLAILDMIMPKMNGIDLIKLIKKLDPSLPIFILSAKDDSESKIKALDMGADDYITKPFEEEELVARVERAIIRSLKCKAGVIIDWLTGAYTKDYFWKRVEEQKEHFNRNKRKFSVAFIDMDNFKLINDTYGHLAGDEVLRNFVCILRETLRSTDQVFRFGGDEFVVLLPETDVISTYNIIERFRRKIDNIKNIKSNLCISPIISFSAGITEVYGVEDNVESIIDRADKALYAAKEYGKNRTCSYDNLSLMQIET